jgi:DUF4097 and DUF4098 domain-containing protein YvlB
MNVRLIRVLPILAVASIAAGSTGCVVTVDAGRYSTREEKVWQVSGTPDVTLITFDGSVEVRSWDKPEVRIEVDKQAADKAQADAIEVKAEQSGNAITFEAKKPAAAQSLFGLKVSPSAKIIATLPRACNVIARTGDGSISVERIDGSVELNSGDGNLKVVELSGRVKAHTGDGSLTFEDIQGTADIDTGDGSGEVNGRLAALRLRTGDGTLTVRADAGSAMTEDWELRTGDGSVRLELPEAFAANLDASTGDGRVHLEGFAEGGGEAAGPGGEPPASVKRPLGAGGKTLRIRSGSGSISIKKL